MKKKLFLLHESLLGQCALCKVSQLGKQNWITKPSALVVSSKVH